VEELSPRRMTEVSIRAPHFHAGRRIGVPASAMRVMFQSAPRTFMRGDRSSSAIVAGTVMFQSAPRTFMRGDTNCGDRRTCAIVSIRAPHFHAGRPFADFFLSLAAWFQSAPRTFMRGDRSTCSSERRCTRFNPRPALSCGATAGLVAQAEMSLVSIRAPHFHAGRLSRSGRFT